MPSRSFPIARASALILALTAAILSARADDDALRRTIARELADPALAHGWTGVLIKSLDDHRVLYQMNEERLFIPASNMKLFVTSCATDVLPPNFAYTTPLLRDGSLDGSTLRGSLYLKGSGDSTLETKDLRQLARAVKSAGITRVEGDVVGDASVFDDESLGYGWASDDLAYYYSAEISGLTVDRATATVRITPGKVGEPPAVSLDPDAGYLLVRSTATTVPDSREETISVGRLLGTNVVTVSGGVRRGNKDATFAVTMTDPAAYTAFLFRALLREQGVTVTGAARTGKVPDGATLVAEHRSPELPAILALINKPSDNLIAESLLKTLGLLKKNAGTASAGADVEREYLKRMGVDPGILVIADGSGLSRHNNVTPASIIAILQFMWSHPNREGFVKSLPVAGVDGSLRRRMVNTPAAGKVMAKTGYVGKARSLSGYVTARDGETYAFSMIMNHYNGTTADVNGIQDRILAAIAASTR